MKRHILLLLFVLIGINAMAQEFSAGDIGKKPIDIYGSKVYMDNCKLDKNDAAACFSSIDGVDMSKEYLKYRAGYKTGIGLIAGGASLAVVGLGTALVGFATAYEQGLASKDISTAETVMNVGLISVVTGSLCFLAGIPTACVFHTRLNRLEKKYNTSLSLGASPAGLSMAINF